MAISFQYWDDCVDPQDLEAMWKDPNVTTEWINAGETKGSKVHLSRDPDGEPFLTQTEMKAVAGIIVSRHFVSQIDSDMLCAIAELESDRRPLITRCNKKSKESTVGIMQISPKIAEWLVSDLRYRTYDVHEDSKRICKPFINVYLAAAYLKWLSNYEHIERSEEFMVRAYKGGTKKATHKSTLQYWKNYLSVKESLPSRKVFEVRRLPSISSTSVSNAEEMEVPENTSWESRASPEDIEMMWNNSSVSKEWTRSKEQHGKLHFSHDTNKKPYLSHIELRAVAQIIHSKHFSTSSVKPTVLCAIAEIVSMRLLNGVGQRIGLMGIDYPTACWLYRDIGYKAYMVVSVDDLTKPFVSMYFGAAYLAWLSEYEESERRCEFVVQAYLLGPKNVNLQDISPHWLRFEEALCCYESLKKERSSCCTIL